MSTPQITTQSRHPWRTVTRTVFQVVVAFAIGFPIVAGLLGGIPLTPALVKLVGIGLVVSGVLTRLMANPRVELILRKIAPWLAAGKIETDTTLTVKEMSEVVKWARDVVSQVMREQRQGSLEWSVSPLPAGGLDPNPAPPVVDTTTVEVVAPDENTFTTPLEGQQ